MTRTRLHPKSLVVIMLVGVLLFLYVGVLAPVRRNITDQEEALQKERNERRTLSEMMAAETDLGRFRDLLPEEDRLPSMTEEILQTAETHALIVQAISYHPQKVALPGLSAVSLVFDVEGDELNVRKFMGAMEQSKMFLIWDHWGLSEMEQAERGQARLSIAMTAYMRKTNAVSSPVLRQPSGPSSEKTMALAK